MTHNHPSGGKKEIVENLSLQLTKKELELSALLELTKAINANQPENALYKIFHFSLLGNLSIPRLALYVFDNEWLCKVSYGVKNNQNHQEIIAYFSSITEIHYLDDSSNTLFPEYQIIIPISHKNQVLAYVIIGGLKVDSESGDTNSQLSFIKTFSSILIVAIENKKLARKQLNQEILKKEIEIARDVQSMLFPKHLPQNNQVQIQATYHPNMSIGGDYYDYISIDKDRFIICIADVSGKGIAAALLMSNFQAAIRILVRQTIDLKKIVKELNHCIMSNANGEKFVTFFIALINLSSKELSYVNAGHNPPILIQANNNVSLLEKGCTILGVFENLSHMEEEKIQFSSNTTLFTYTDGLTETYNESGTEFGIEKVQEFLLKNKDLELERLHEMLNYQLNMFKGNMLFPDDITFMTCKLN